MNTNQDQQLNQNSVSQSSENNQTIEGVQKGEFYQKIISFLQPIPSGLKKLFVALFKPNSPSKPG